MKIRNPKSETRKKAEVRNPNGPPVIRAATGRTLGSGEGPRSRALHVPAQSEFATLACVLWPSFGCRTSAVGLRASAFFRPSGFGFQPLWVLVYVTTSILLCAADTNLPPDEMASSLKPPKPEILPTFWEQHGTWIAMAAVLLVTGIAFTVWLRTRPKPLTPVPLAVQARQELEPLREQPENGALLSRSSQIVRRYITASFSFPAGESTTSDLCRAMMGCEKIGAGLASEIGDFLRECDLRKFAPSAPVTPLGAIARSLNIIARAESRLAEVNQAESGSTTGPDLSSAARGASGA